MNSEENYQKKVVILGSAATQVGATGEYDCAVTQAIFAFKTLGYSVVVISPNIATVQTDNSVADTVYFVPLTVEHVQTVLAKEKPHLIAIQFGGKQAMQCGMDLQKQGILQELTIELLGFTEHTLQVAHNRFSQYKELESITVHTPKSELCTTREEALKAAQTIQFPVVVRSTDAFGIPGIKQALNETELDKLTKQLLAVSPEILIAEDCTGWKELEVELLTDVNGCSHIIGIIEDIDAVGIHSVDSIRIIPPQSLSYAELELLERTALHVSQELSFCGTSMIRFALHAKSQQYRILSIHFHWTRTSCLLAKATCVSFAYLAVHMLLGTSSAEVLKNQLLPTQHSFSTQFNHIAVVLPRWDLQNFTLASKQISTEPKATGAVLAFGRTCIETLQKGIRMLQIGAEGITDSRYASESIREELRNPTPKRLFTIAQALLKEEWNSSEIAIASSMQPWFIEQIALCTTTEKQLQQTNKFDIKPELLQEAKQHGLSDAHIGKILDLPTSDVRTLRKRFTITPVLQQVHAVQTSIIPLRQVHTASLLYTSYFGTEDFAISAHPKQTLVLGANCSSIESGFEYDWCCYQALETCNKESVDTITLQQNPYAVSTELHLQTSVLFEEPTVERILDCQELFRFKGVICSMSGVQTLALAPALANAGLTILDTTSTTIEALQERSTFSGILASLQLKEPSWKECHSIQEIKDFCASISYPAILRNVDTRSSTKTVIVHSDLDVEHYASQCIEDLQHVEVLVTDLQHDSKVLTLETVAQTGKLLHYTVAEHIEYAGVHPGDTSLIMPPQHVNLETIRTTKFAAQKLVAALSANGPMTIRCIVHESEVSIVDCQCRTSKHFAFASKVSGVNLAAMATKALLGIEQSKTATSTIDLDHVAVKVPQFCFYNFEQADPQLTIEKVSTGSACYFSSTTASALIGALEATGVHPTEKTAMLSIGPLEDKVELLSSIKALQRMGYKFYATKHTHEFLLSRNVDSVLLFQVSEPRNPNVTEYLEHRRVQLVINIATAQQTSGTDGYKMRRLAVQHFIPLLTNVSTVQSVVKALEQTQGSTAITLAWPQLLESYQLGKLV